MKNSKNILLGLIDGILPGFHQSIKKTNDGQTEVNKARLIACLLAYGCFVALLKGWLKIEVVAELLKILLTTDLS